MNPFHADFLEGLAVDAERLAERIEEENWPSGTLIMAKWDRVGGLLLKAMRLRQAARYIRTLEGAAGATKPG